MTQILNRNKLGLSLYGDLSTSLGMSHRGMLYSYIGTGKVLAYFTYEEDNDRIVRQWIGSTNLLKKKTEIFISAMQSLSNHLLTNLSCHKT